MESLVEWKSKLIFEFGLLCSPIRDWLQHPDCHTHLGQLEGRFRSEYGDDFAKHLDRYCIAATIQNSFEHNEVRRSINDMLKVFDDLRSTNNREAATRLLDHVQTVATRALTALPASDPDQIFPRESPYSTYCRLLSLFQSASSRIDLFDPYLDEQVYYRYFGNLPTSVTLRIITHSKNTMNHAGRGPRVIAVSELLASEKKDKYQLWSTDDIHDRHLRIDGQIFHLGGTVKDGGKNSFFTISKLNSGTTHQVLDKIISESKEWFGPNLPLHRQFGK